MSDQSAASAFAAAPAAAPAAATAPVALTVPTEGAPAAPAAPANEAWYSGIQNPELKTWVEAKGFKDASQAADSAWNLEKLIGHDKAGRTVVLPKDGATPEEIKAFNTKLGVPDSPDGYKLPVPEGQDATFAKEASSWFHEAGVTPKAANTLAEKWNAHMAQQAQATQAAQAAKADQEFSAVVTGWGAEADAKLEMGRRAAAEYLPAANPQERQQLLQRVEAAMGTRQFLEMFSKLGSGLRESTFIDGSGAGNNYGMSPVEAQSKITALKGDKDWSASYLSGDKTKLAEMTRLTQIAYPQGKQ